jgi:hypothetical protein
MDRKELLDRIQQKQAELDQIKIDLKNKFFGIDHQIDKILEYIKAWYITPEIISRPLIINLWGLTGVGKTSLIRELVSKLKFTNKFVEIQMGDDPSTGSYSRSNICSILKQSAIGEKEPGIILLDEFQRFRTVDAHGGDVKDQKFQDIWMLLSDGKFAKDYSLFERIMDFTEYNLVDYETELDEEEEQAIKKAKKKKSFVSFKDRKLSRWQVRTLKNLLGNYCTVEYLKNKTVEDAEQIIKDYLESDANGSIDYSKCLIFVSGNLDEAYHMSEDVEDCDTDADIFHKLTTTISITEIKRALNTRFKPEQIARLGNNHIIYPSLTRNAYEKIIANACKKFIEDAREIADINFNVKESVISEIYDNSVYPTQGTRPVFSSIHKMFASPLTNGLFWGLTNDIKDIDVNISSAKSAIIFSHDRQAIEVPIDFDIRDKKNKYTKDFTSMLAVHESGHAIAYALLFKHAPKQIKINLASFTGGFNQVGFKTGNKESMLNQISCLLAGTVAEQIIFGGDLRSGGCENDLLQATGIAALCIRKLGMGRFNSYMLVTDKNTHNENIDGSNEDLEALVTEQRDKTFRLLTEHRDILVRCSKILVTQKELSAKEFNELFGDELNLDKTLDVNSYDTQGDYYNILMNHKS